MKKKEILNKINDLRNQREESEKEVKHPQQYSEGWEDGYDCALERLEEFVEDDE